MKCKSIGGCLACPQVFFENESRKECYFQRVSRSNLHFIDSQTNEEVSIAYIFWKICSFFIVFFTKIICICKVFVFRLHFLSDKQWFFHQLCFKITHNISVFVKIKSAQFLAHLSWKLKWAILIARCPSSVCLSVNFYIFDFFSRTTGQILIRLGTNHPWGKGIQVCSNEGDHLSLRGDNSERLKKNRILKKNLLLQNHKA
jgi:hypothetical protein